MLFLICIRVWSLFFFFLTPKEKKKIGAKLENCLVASSFVLHENVSYALEETSRVSNLGTG